MARTVDPLEGDVIRQASPDEGEWIAVPAPFFVGGEFPPFALFDHNRRVADLRLARTVYVSPSDAGELNTYVRRRLAALQGSSRAELAARAWALHRALALGADEVLRAPFDHPGRPAQLRPVTELARLAAGWVPAQPAPYLAALDQGDQSAATHGATTALFALMLGVATGIDDLDILTDLTLGGLLADAGKASMPDSIRQNTGPLSGDEWDLMRQHPERAVALLQRAGVRSARTLRAVRSHHERWGGGGYPDRLRGDAIPVEARIVGIADAFAALTVDRPFTSARRGYDALAEMASSTGQFDPVLLRTFVTTIGTILPARERWGAA